MRDGRYYLMVLALCLLVIPAYAAREKNAINDNVGKVLVEWQTESNRATTQEWILDVTNTANNPKNINIGIKFTNTNNLDWVEQYAMLEEANITRTRTWDWKICTPINNQSNNQTCTTEIRSQQEIIPLWQSLTKTNRMRNSNQLSNRHKSVQFEENERKRFKIVVPNLPIGFTGEMYATINAKDYHPFLNTTYYELLIFNTSNNNTANDINETSSLYSHGDTFGPQSLYEQQQNTSKCILFFPFDEGNHNTTSTNYRDICGPTTYVMVNNGTTNMFGDGYRYNTSQYKFNNSAFEIFYQDTNKQRMDIGNTGDQYDGRPGLGGLTNWTMGLWIYPYEDPGSDSGTIFNRNLQAVMYVQTKDLSDGSGSNFTGIIYGPGCNLWNASSDFAVPLTIREWQHIALQKTYNGATSCTKLFRNGVQRVSYCNAAAECINTDTGTGTTYLFSRGPSAGIGPIPTGVFDDLVIKNYAQTDWTDVVSDMRLRTNQITSSSQVRMVFFNYSRVSAANGALVAVNVSANGGGNFVLNVSMNTWTMLPNNGTKLMYQFGVFTNGNPFTGDNITIHTSSNSYFNDNNHTWTSPDYETNSSFFQMRCYTSPCENATLYWNGTAYPATGNNTDGGVTTFNTTVNIPLLNSDGIVVDWNWGYYNATAYINESVSTQTLNQKWKIASLAYQDPVSISQAHNITAHLTDLDPGGSAIADKKIEYNGVNYSTNSLNSTSYYTFVTAPSSSGTVNVRSFITITYNTTQIMRSFSGTQSVGTIGSGSCTTPANATINVTLWNEETLELFNSSVDATFTISVSNPLYGTNVTTGTTWRNQSSYCLELNPDNTYRTNGLIVYCQTPTNNQLCQLDQYDTRAYYVWNLSLPQASTTYLNLYVVNNSKAQEVTIQVHDDTDKAMPDMIINVMRWYPGANQYRTVEHVRTDDQGKALTKLILYTVQYKFVVEDSKGNVVLVTPELYGQEIYNTLIELVVNTRVSFMDTFNKVNGITHQLVYLDATGTFRLTYLDSNSIQSQVCLEVLKKQPRGDSLICRNCLNDASGTILCNIGGSNLNGTYIANAYVVSNTPYSNYLLDTLEYTYSVAKAIAGQFKTEGLFYAMLLSGTLGFIGLMIAPSFGILLFVFGLIGAYLLNLISLTWTSIIFLITLAIVFIVRMREQ